MSNGVVPSVFIDEITPPPRTTPDDWIIQRGDAFFFECPPGFFDDAVTSEALRLTDGTIYEFQRVHDFGDAILTIKPDRSFTAAPPMPPQAEIVYAPPDPDTVSDTVEELVENCGDDLGPGEHELEYYAWNVERWIFEAAGKRFVAHSDEPPQS